MNDVAAVQAANCIENLHRSVSSVEFGYKVQALAAHILLRLDYRVEEINRSGHPDIIATRDMDELHFEVEADVAGPRPRKLTNEDFASLTELASGVGYFALAISFPTPRWVLVPAERLKNRRPTSNVLLEALSDADFCKAWTYAYMNLLEQECRLIQRASFRELCERALAGRGL